MRKPVAFQAVVIMAVMMTLGSLTASRADELKVGVRPYEMDWANRTQDDFPPLVDFETSLDGWKVETKDAIASFKQSREEQMFGKYVAKLTYRADGSSPLVFVRPPKPVPVPATSFDAMSCWINGNNWAWVTDKETPRVTVEILFLFPDGKEIGYNLTYVRWNDWFLCPYRFTEEQQKALNTPGVSFNGFKIIGGRNVKDRVLYFDNFALFKEVFKPLDDITKRPQRGIAMFPGQSVGQNTGTGKLPFPTREETILPDSSAPGAKNSITADGKSFLLQYKGSDGNLTIRYTPETGTWSDLQAVWNNSEPFLPLAKGGINKLVGGPDTAAKNIAAAVNETPEPVLKRTLLNAGIVGEKLSVRWSLASEHFKTEVEYNFQLMGKSLVLDTFCKGGKVPAVEFGMVDRITNPQVVLIPYYSYGGGNRPKAVLFNVPKEKSPLFILAHVDWYRSNGSNLIGASGLEKTSASTNGVVHYNPKTDGLRNDVYERFFIGISPQLPEVLPNIPNPISPWKHVTGKGVWRAYGASPNRENDQKYWHNIWRHGMRHIIVTDHETCWRDGGESFTFRTNPAPKKGGDKGQYDYARYMQDKLGFVYGPYNNFTDFAPVNGFWNYDMVSRTSTNQLQHAWARCYAPKPSRAVEYCEKLTPIIEKKFDFSTAYCDVHTAVTPWSRTDYDARVPGAGTFAAVFYPYGEIMLLQKKNWNGPVYSEGPHHCFYSGLSDGNYAQDYGYYFPENPWLVDFDLLKMHDHECNFGMGATSMYDPKLASRNLNPKQMTDSLDRFAAATLAFGHPGFLVSSSMADTMIGYFMIQQIASYYTQVSVESILYRDENGKDFSISEALANKVFQRNQLNIRYKDGTQLYINGNLAREPMKVQVTLPSRNESTGKMELRRNDVEIPANGYIAHTKDYKVCVQAMCKNGARFDYCDSPEYIFLNGRGMWQNLPKASGAGLGVCRLMKDNTWEIITLNNAEMGFAITADKATAFDFAGKELGPAQLRQAGDYLFVVPVPGAFSYTLEKTAGNVSDKKQSATSGRIPVARRSLVVAGEKLTAYDRNDPKKTYDFQIPKTAKPGEVVSFEPEKGMKVYFFVVPLSDATVSLNDDCQLTVQANCRLPGNPPMKVTVSVNGQEKKTVFNNNGKYKTVAVTMLDKPDAVKVEKLSITFSSGEFQQTIQREMKTTHETVTCPPLLESGEGPDICKSEHWAQLRDKEPTQDLPSIMACVFWQAMSCHGESKDGYFIHPPYKGGVGRTWIDFEFVVNKVKGVAPVFRTFVGKRDGSDLGDGILFQVATVTQDGKETVLAKKTVLDHQWYPLEVSLSKYIGQKIKLRLISDVGVKNNSAGDWSCWGVPHLETGEKVYQRTLQ